MIQYSRLEDSIEHLNDVVKNRRVVFLLQNGFYRALPFRWILHVFDLLRQPSVPIAQGCLRVRSGLMVSQQHLVDPATTDPRDE